MPAAAGEPVQSNYRIRSPKDEQTTVYRTVSIRLSRSIKSRYAVRKSPITVRPISERIEELSIPEPNSGCWLWLAAATAGYGRISVPRRKGSAKAHRVSYETFVGPIPDGLVIDHLCRNTMCVNPDHLEPVTNEENLRRSPLFYGAQTKCKNGHEYTPETVTIRIRGNATERICKLCTIERARKQRAQTLGLDDPRHGTGSGYNNYGCRCDPCKVAGAERWQRIRAGKPGAGTR